MASGTLSCTDLPRLHKYLVGQQSTGKHKFQMHAMLSSSLRVWEQQVRDRNFILAPGCISIVIQPYKAVQSFLFLYVVEV